ncbi:hypothetical protein [Sulfurospirillum sp.]|jgi:hypothetical protein|uniref:hypothetical protein n=1 Tax=Sulfurospirillum sp. TaxID=2053622 RepID=UPI002FDD6483
MKIVKTLLISIVLVFSGITSAHAMGDREKGALLGAGAVVLLGGLINASQQPTRYVESSTYYEPRPTVVYREPVYVQERVIYVEPSPRYYYPPRHHHRDYDDGYYRSYR